MQICKYFNNFKICRIYIEIIATINYYEYIQSTFTLFLLLHEKMICIFAPTILYIENECEKAKLI
jgi:hypothetical protein